MAHAAQCAALIAPYGLKGSRISSVRHIPRVKKPPIDCGIDDDDHTSEHELDPAGEAGRIDNCQEIVLNEALRVTRFARFDTKVVLQVRKWANATGELNEETPCGNWKLNNEDPAPSQSD